MNEIRYFNIYFSYWIEKYKIKCLRKQLLLIVLKLTQVDGCKSTKAKEQRC